MILHVHRPRMTNEDLLRGNHESWAGGAKDDRTEEIKRAEEIYKWETKVFVCLFSTSTTADAKSFVLVFGCLQLYQPATVIVAICLSG